MQPFEQPQRGRREVQAPACTTGDQGAGVELQVPDAQEAAPAAGRPPGQGLEPGVQLGERERLREVVVGHPPRSRPACRAPCPGRSASGSVWCCRRRQPRRRHSVRPSRIRQPEIQHDHLVGLRGGEVEARSGRRRRSPPSSPRPSRYSPMLAARSWLSSTIRHTHGRSQHSTIAPAQRAPWGTRAAGQKARNHRISSRVASKAGRKARDPGGSPMSIVITTPTGHIGSKLTEQTPRRRRRRHAHRPEPREGGGLAARGAKVAAGLAGGRGVRRRGHARRHGAVLAHPAQLPTSDFRAYQRRMGAIAARAIAVNNIPRVVHLSSVGAQLGQGVGPGQRPARHREGHQRRGTNVTHLRPGGFMENVLMSLDTVKTAGAMFLPVPSTPRCRWWRPGTSPPRPPAPARRLWSGVRAVTLYGPEELGYDDVAATLTRELGKPVSHVQVTPDRRARRCSAWA